MHVFGDACAASMYIPRGTALADAPDVCSSVTLPEQQGVSGMNMRPGNLAAGRAVVTGGAGFLGSHLCARLLEEGFSVVAIDNLVTGNLQNLEPLLTHSSFRFLKHDVTVPIGIEADYIFNLACCASPQHYQRDPEKTMRTCMEGALHMLHEAVRCGARIFQASTSEV